VQLEKYVKDIQNWIKPYFAEKQPTITSERCCINITTKEISLVQINRVNGEIELLRAESLPYDDMNNLPLVLAGLVKRYALNTVPIYWLLQTDDYHLFLIDSLPVPKNEFREALNWRIRSLISYPIEVTQ